MNKFFFFKDLDSHYVIYILGIRLCIKHKCKLKFKEITEIGINTEIPREPKIIVSMTSYPARIKTVHLSLNSLLQQNLKPDKIVLWLTDEDFPQKENDLPSELLNLKQFGVEIRWFKNLKSYKKLVPALEAFPNDIIITVDDDVFYQPDMIKSLYYAYLKNPNNIYVKRSVKLCVDNNKIKSISSRKYLYKHLTEPSYLNQIMGGSGCLYPPGALYKDATNQDIIEQTIPTHDDVYFWTMAVLNKTKIQVIGGFNEDLLFIDGTQDVGLIHINKNGQQGVGLEEAYDIMINKYPQLLSILNE